MTLSKNPYTFSRDNLNALEMSAARKRMRPGTRWSVKHNAFMLHKDEKQTVQPPKKPGDPILLLNQNNVLVENKVSSANVPGNSAWTDPENKSRVIFRQANPKYPEDDKKAFWLCYERILDKRKSSEESEEPEASK